jgi:hypothetical protein
MILAGISIGSVWVVRFQSGGTRRPLRSNRAKTPMPISWRVRFALLRGSTGRHLRSKPSCAAAGQLLEEPHVAKWVAASYPVILVDEAQELAAPRLRVVRALAPHVSLYVAADEFQCLDQRIDTRPFVEWFSTGRITSLTQIRRTSHQGLLDAALALREGRAVPNTGPGLRISYQHPNQTPFAIGHALHSARRSGGSIAMIVAPGTARWVETLLPRLRQGMRTKNQTVLPLAIEREKRSDEDIDRIVAILDQGSISPAVDAIRLLREIADPPAWLPQVTATLVHQQRACGVHGWTPDDLRMLIQRKANLHRGYGYQRQSGIPVITIQSAKNRQFCNVVVLWGAGVHGDGRYKARLLYNAITRADANCTVFVQTQQLLSSPPFQVVPTGT